MCATNDNCEYYNWYNENVFFRDLIKKNTDYVVLLTFGLMKPQPLFIFFVSLWWGFSLFLTRQVRRCRANPGQRVRVALQLLWERLLLLLLSLCSGTLQSHVGFLNHFYVNQSLYFYNNHFYSNDNFYSHNKHNLFYSYHNNHSIFSFSYHDLHH